jgi:hypothetical protein
VVTLKRLLLLVWSLAALVLSSASAQAAATIERDIPFDFIVPGCVERVHLSGSLLGVFTLTESATGGYVMSSHYQPQGLTGIGLTTGKTYRATGLTREATAVTPAGGSTYTFVNQFHIVGTAGAVTFTVREIVHVTVTPSGDVTASVENVSSSC